MGMPKLKKCVLMGGLKNVKSVRMENAGKLESVKGLKEVVEEERKRREEERKKREEEEEERKRREEERKREERKRREEERRKREEMMALAKTTVSVKCVGDLKNANCYVGVIVIASNCCNDSELSVLVLSRFVNLREFIVGDECFENVNEVKLIGLKELERVVIGQKSFTKKKDDSPMSSLNPYRHFCLRDCERITLLKIGRYSFADYSVCEIANTNALEVIDIGDLDPDHKCWNFYYASLELKGENNPSRSSIDLSQLQRISIGRAGFNYCNEAVFESYAAKKEVMNRLAGVGSYQSGFECPRHERS